jgi:peptidoglycan/LPS O-acetylase OafA/YrhL
MSAPANHVDGRADELVDGRIHERVHGLDALRAFALLLGILLHSTMPYVLPPGMWAIGTTQPSMVLGLVAFYVHSFRLELFFLLAGYFGALVIARRGAIAYLRDRATRILLVFIVALYPMKFVLAALWITGGRQTGWLKLPPAVASLSWFELSLGSFAMETWPAVALTHLWFLYYLACLSAMFLAARWLVLDRAAAPRWTFVARLARALDAGFRAVISSRLAPVALAVAVTPLLTMMQGMDIDTPDGSFAWHLPVMTLYACCFALGWLLSRQTELLSGALSARWKGFLLTGLVAALVASTGVGMRYAGGEWVTMHATALRWATSFGTSLTMMASVLGWMGCFVRLFGHESARIRYVADASYWIYIVHLPIVVGLQLLLAGSGMPWWIQVPLVNIVTFTLLLATYHACVRFTWVGAWLNGRRRTRYAAPDTGIASGSACERLP